MTDDEFNDLFRRVMDRPIFDRDVFLLVAELHRRLAQAKAELKKES
jgi:hypothetical protein